MMQPSRGTQRRIPLRTLAACFLVTGLACAAIPRAQAADAEPYPSRPLRIVVPTAPGPGDVAARYFGRRLSEALGQPVTIENRPGASYNIASEVVAKAPADGYTLLYTGSVVTLLPSVLGQVAVDPVAAFAPVIKLLDVPLVIVVNPALGVRTLGELLALAAKRPGQIAYATPGVGTVPHLSATMIAQRAGVDLLHVPYVNVGQALKDTLSGEVPVYLNFLVTLEAHIKSGALRPLAAASTRRLHALPDVPSLAELGFKDAAFDPWLGIFAPRGTPREIVERLNREFAKILLQADTREQLAAFGMEPLGSTPERFGADVREAVARWPAIVRAAGIRRE